ncbi:MAG TPA: rRNA maturation RNase YbeY [Candidatus Paceibacterota bacterium]
MDHTLTVELMHNGTFPTLPLFAVKNDILGKKYALSVVCVRAPQSEKLHQQFKHKDGPADILSFPFEKDSGEIILHLPSIRAKAASYDRTFHEHLLFILIHGCLHLKGFTHGSKMETEERKYYKKYLPMIDR